MCLYIDAKAHGPKDFHGKREGRRDYHHARVATRDIVVYKILRRADSSSGLSPYQYTRYDFGKKYTTSKLVNHKLTATRSGWGGPTIEEGLHAFHNYDDAVSRTNRMGANARLYYAIIPKGSKLFFGTRGEIVSSALIVYRTKNDLVKNHGPIGDPVRKSHIAK